MTISTSSIYTRWARTLIGIEIALWDRIDARLQKELGITLVTYEALRFLDRSQSKSLRVGELAEKLHLTVGGASKLVDRLVAGDLVRRELDRADRRASRIVLSEQGRETVAAASISFESEVAALLDAALSPGEVQQMHEQLSRVWQALRTSATEP